MKFSLTHRFPCRPEELFELLEHPDLEAILAREGKVVREVVERRVSPDGTRFRRVKCRPDRTVPAYLKPFVGPEGIVYFQISEGNFASGLLRWRVETPAMGERMKVSGTTRVEPDPAGCRRVIEGEVTVEVRLVGGAIEKYVADELQRSYDKAAVAVAAFMAARPRPGA
jgi:hypothetical protein